MAKETVPLDSKSQQPNQATPVAAAPKAGLSLKKILTIGGPILVVQIVVVYFLVAKYLAPPPAQGATAQVSTQAQGPAETEKPQIVVIKDVIVNPAGTNGSHLLVTSIGLEVPTVETKTELEEKEVQTRDILVTILTGKRMDELSTPEQKESLRQEIQGRIDQILRSAKLKKVYFSKFIIQ